MGVSLDKYISASKMINFLNDSKLMIPEGYGRGIPVYTDKGLGTINNFISLFKDTFKQIGIDFKELSGNKLIERKYFFKMYKGINDYSDEIVGFNDYLVMSDALIDSAYYLVDNYKGDNITTLTISSVYRDKVDKLVPLYKDRNIYPVIQIDQLVTGDNYHKNIIKLKEFYIQFFNKIGIDIAFLETSEVPNYAKNELYFLTHDKGALTKVGMIYDLSQQFKNNLGVFKGVDFFDSGVSGKSLYKSLEISSLYGKSFLIHPNVAYTDLLIAHSNEGKYIDVKNRFDTEKIRYVNLNSTKKSYKIWKKSGIQHYLLIHDFLTLFSKGANGEIKELLFNNIDDVIYKMKQDKITVANEILERSRRILREIKSKYTVKMCKECYGKKCYGYYSDNNQYTCKSCKKNIDRLILNIDPKKRFY